MLLLKLLALMFILYFEAHAAHARGPLIPHGGWHGSFLGPHSVSLRSYARSYQGPLSMPSNSGPSLSYVGAQTPDAEWTPMFSSPSNAPQVVGTPISSLKGSAKGSYIYVAPGRRGSSEFSTTIQGVPPAGTIEWSKK